MKELPLHDIHVGNAATLAVVDGVTIPTSFTGLDAEVAALRAGVALVDQSHRGRIELLGPDRTSFLDGQATNRLRDLPDGQVVKTSFLNGKGKMRGDGFVHIDGERLLVDCDRGAVDELLAHLRGFVIMDDVTIDDVSESTVEFGLHGPNAPGLIKDLLGVELDTSSDPRRFVHAEGVLAAADPDTAGCGYRIFTPTANAPGLYEKLAERATLVGEEAMETLRVELGRPRWGREIDLDTIPIEVGLLDTIDYEKGCFTGYEVVARIRTYGHVNRNLVGLRLDRPAPAKTQLMADDKAVGHLTTVAGALALGIVRREAAAPKTRLQLVTPEGETFAEVVELPFASPGP